MAVRGKKWCNATPNYLQALATSLGLSSVGIGMLALQVEGQPPLEPVCVGIAPLKQQKSSSKTLQHQCCKTSIKAQCHPWQQLFPNHKQYQIQTLKRPPAKASDLFSPQLDEFGNSVGSGGAAKDAVIQVGVTKALDVLVPQLKSQHSEAQTSKRPNFFQRVRKDYERILGPKELNSGAILTPQIGVNMDLGRFNVNSMNLGVQIKW
jgi:hypothetical protein